MGHVSNVIGLLTVLTDIQAFLFFILRHTQAHNHVDYFKNNPGTDHRKSRYRADHEELNHQEFWIAKEQSIVPGSIDRLRRK